MKKISLIIIAIVFFISGAGLSADEDISNAIKKFAQNRKRTRIAVFDFSNTSGEKTRYDAHIADTIVTELGKYPLTLLERKRLEVILKENELSQSGLVDAEKAMKFGTLLPVDVIVSGSYTEIGGKIVINGRFIHVGTGEIIHTFTASMESVTSGGETKAEKPECPDTSAIKSALLDLRDNAAIEKAVNAAIKVPFDGECGKIHYEVMYTFSRYKILNETYKNFIIKTLESIENPSVDSRTMEIMYYFAADEKIDDAEWKASLEMLKKMKSAYYLSVPLRRMLNNAREKDALVRERSVEIMTLASEKKIGRPVPIEKEQMFLLVLTALYSSGNKDRIPNTLFFFNRYRGIIPDTDENNKRILATMKSMYFADAEINIHKEALNNLIDFYKSRKESEFLAESAADLIKSAESMTDNNYEHDKNKNKIFSEDIKYINKSLEGLYCLSVDSAAKKHYRYIVEDRTIYILKNKMKCGYVPLIKDLENDMRSGDWEKKLKAIELLSKIGEAAKEAEKTVIKYLGQQGFGSDGARLRRLCAQTLGNIRTTDPQGITLLIESFPDYEGASHEAEEAIKKIGIDAIPYLITGLRHKDHAARLRCAKALGNLGAGAKKALPELERLAVKDEDPYVQKEARGAVQMIKNDY